MQQFLDAAPDSGKALISIDQREDRIFDVLLQSYGASVDRRTLDVGDFLCSARLVVERKARPDFEQSIIDGRLFTQLHNMASNYGRVVVIVEGTSDDGRLSREALLGAYSSIISDFGASIMFTRSMEKTAEMVFALAKHEQLSRKQPMRVFAKRKALTISQSQRAIIEMLPMVGPKLARALLSHFGSVDRIVSAGEKELLEVQGMGRKRAKLIHAILFAEYDEESDELRMH